MRTSLRILALAAVVAAATSCGDASRQSRSPVLLNIDLMVASAGGGNSGGPQNASFLLSDVQTKGGVFDDFGVVTFRVSPKNPSPGITPTTLNSVSIERYHVEYIRADGHNTPGVDVPFPFDGSVAITIAAGGSGTVGFELVRHVAKEEAPLLALVNSANIIYTIGRVTFFAHDLAGNEMSVVGEISVNFGNFADSAS
ncbi:MAG TPA: hypothetical protein VIW45_11985 [Vicinamibacterales bacterium]|jgi:hypothetical protein